MRIERKRPEMSRKAEGVYISIKADRSEAELTYPMRSLRNW